MSAGRSADDDEEGKSRPLFTPLLRLTLRGLGVLLETVCALTHIRRRCRKTSVDFIFCVIISNACRIDAEPPPRETITFGYHYRGRYN